MMATFEIQAPDGQKYRVEGETQEGALAALKKMLGQQPEDRSKWGTTETINNAINQIGTGIYTGMANVAGLPRLLTDLIGPSSPKVRGVSVPENQRDIGASLHLPSGEAIMAGMEKYVPGFKRAPAETTADKFLQAGGQGASAVFLPGAPIANFAGGVTGSVASEGAGQATEGTPLEPWARVLAGLAGGVGGALTANKLGASNVEQLINRATNKVTPEQWNAAMRLQADAASRGAPITSAEALAQVQGGNRTLQSIQRTVEQMPETAPRMDAFMAARPGGNQAAMAGQLDNIAAPPAAPFEVAPKVQQAAQKSINGLRQQINDVTDDLYRYSDMDMIPPAEFAPIAESPIFQHYAAIVRKDPILGPSVAGLDDNSITFVNAVKKEMGESAEAFSAYGTPTTSPTRAMRLGETQRPMVEAAKKSSPVYEAALEKQALLRSEQLDPMRRGLTGQLAETADWKQQAKILLSDTPGAEKEVAAAVKAISKTAPEVMPGLLRMKLESAFNAAVPSAKGMTEQFRGANFAGKLLANPQQAKSLEAAVKAFPNGETQWAGFRRLLDVFEAQGQRLLPGSPTSFNQQLAGTMQKNLGQGIKSLGVSIWSNWNVERRAAELARILTDPEGVKLLRQLAILGPNSARAQQLVNGFYGAVQGVEPAIDIRKAGGTPQLQQAPQ